MPLPIASLFPADPAPELTQDTTQDTQPNPIPGPALEAPPAHPPPPPSFGEEPELPPTWTEGSLIFHTTEKCTRLQAIRKNRRISGRPGIAMRSCFNCEDILRTKRTG